MADTDKAEWYLLDTDLTTRLSILPVERSHLYLELSEPGSGELKIPLDSTAAGLVSSGMFCQCLYRGTSRGGFFVDNIAEFEADASEGGGRWMSISGRGPLALLEDAIIWDDGTTSTTRTFTAKTKAYILRTLIIEAQARGVLSVLTVDFADDKDSDGAAWTDSEDYKLNVGMSLLELVRQFAKTGIEFNVALSGGAFVLYAYVTEYGTDKSSTIYMRTGTNCEEVKGDERGDDIKNALRVLYKGGYITVKDDVSIAARRRRERLLNIKAAQTTTSATTYASAIIDNSKVPQKSIAVRVYDGVHPFIFEDYGLGDYVMLDVVGTKTKYRILGIQADFDGVDYSSVVLEMNTIFYENDLSMAEDLEWLLNQWNTAQDLDLMEVSFWAAIGNSSDAITQVNCIHVLGDKVYVGGIFTKIGGVNFTASQIAVYDIPTATWSKLVNAPSLLYVYCITSIGTDLYVGGLNGVEKYDTVGETWSLDGDITTTVGGTLPVVNAMAVMGTDLFITGYFDGARLVSVSGLAVYDTVGDAWADVGGGITSGGGGASGDGKALAVIGAILYIGGDIDQVGVATAVANVCSWNTGTSTFDDLDGGLDNTVFSLAVYGTNILAGGLFTGKISEWDGLDWVTFGGGVGGTVRGIAVYLTDVYAVGLFTDVGNRIARYSGGGWTALTTGLNNSAYAVAMHNEDVYVGGIFTTAGDKPAIKIAAYYNNFESLLDYLENSNNGFDMAAAIHNAPASAVTANDEFPFWEDTSNALRKITFTNLRTAIGGGDISGTGVIGQVAEFVTNTKTIQAAKIIGPAANIITITNAAASTLSLAISNTKTLTLTAVDNYNLTIPATGTAALLGTANIFTTTQQIGTSGAAETSLLIASKHATAKWGFLASNNTYNAVRDDVLSIGWNNNNADPTENQLTLNFEANYKYDAGLPSIMEFIVQHNNPNTATAYRPLTITANRTTDLLITLTNGLIYFGSSAGVLDTTKFEAGNWQFTKPIEMLDVLTLPITKTAGGSVTALSGYMIAVDQIYTFVYGLQYYIKPSAVAGNTTVNVAAALSVFNTYRAEAGFTLTMSNPVPVISIAAPVFTGAGTFTFSSNSHQGIGIQNQGNAKFTVSHGIKIEDQTGSSYTLAYQSGKGYSVFGDYVFITGWRDATQLQVTGFTTQTNPTGVFIDNTAATNTVRNVLRIETQSTGAAANGLGAGLLFALESSTTVSTSAGLISASWVDVTHATRKAKLSLSAYDTAVRTGIDIGADGVGSYYQTYGGHISKVTTVTDTYTVLASDETVVCNKATAFTVTLPTATVGQRYQIKNIGVGTVTVDGASTDTIDGVETQVIAQWEAIQIQCRLANTWIIL